jgi:hypothetical protein
MTTLWINQAWPVMFDNVGHDAYWILMGINLIGLIVVVLFWPETKGISLEHMDRIFGQVDKVAAYRDEHQFETVENISAGLAGKNEDGEAGHHESGIRSV